MIPPGLVVARSGTGDGDGPLVMLIHGVMDRASSFRRTMRRLSGFDVVSFDRRGYGDSVGLGPADDLSRHAGDAVAVMGDRRCVVIGHSFGGLVALRAAAERPDLVEALGLYEPPVGWVEGVDPLGPIVDISRPPDQVAEAFFVATVGARAWRRSPEPVRAARRAEGAAIIADLIMAAEGPGMSPAQVLQPVWIAHGDDGTGRYRPGARRLAGLLPDSRVDHIEGAGHGIHLRHPDRFARWIVDLVAATRH